MKKFFTLAVLALTVLACNKEIAEKQIAAPNEGLMTISATTEDLSKVVLDMNAEVNLTWADTDVITVYDGSAANPFTIKSNSGASAVFEGTCDTAASMLYAVYPAAAYAEPAADAIKVVVPATQTIPDGGCVDADALVAVGYAAPGQPMVFKQVCALLKLTVTGSDIMEIVIRGKGLAGTAAVNADGTINASGASLTDEITLHTAAGMFAPGDYFVAVAPGTTPAGSFSINYNTVSATASKTASSEVCFVRAKGLDAGPLTGFSKTVVITTMAELFNWNASRSTADIEDVKIGADIDMEGEPWTPKDFTGTFDGQGHKLYNLNVNRPSNACFFNTVNGTVKDVTFGSSSDSSSIIQNNPEDDGSSWRYAGLITRLNEGATLENVKSFVPVSVAEGSTSKTRIGGLVAVVAGPSTIKNCENHGNVTNNAAAPAAAGAVGGIIGWADAVLTADNVSNFGNITVYNASTSYIGGVLANDGVGSTLSTCSNSGDIDVQFKGIIGMCIGGVLGNATSTKLTGCSNSGGINNICDGELKAGGIVGRIYNGEASIDCSIINCTNKASGTISLNVETPTKNLFAGGIVGNTPSATAGTLLIQGCINRADLSINYPNTNALGGIGGFLNGASGGVKTTVKECENYGNISCTAELNIAINIGGVVGYLNAKSRAGSSIIDCKNHGKVVLNSVKATSYVGGIAAYTSYADIKGCDNLEGASVRCENKYDFSQTLYIGGVFGRFIYGSVSTCSNAGEVYTDNTASGNAITVNRIGGIGGTLHGANSSLTECFNTGAIIVDQSRVLGTGNNWQAAGGILGFQENVESTVSKNTNSGAIDCKFNTTNANASAGGIIGRFGGTLTLSDNRNSGSVTAININTSSTAINCHAGGIIGSSNQGKTGSSVSGNVNTGAVSVGSTNTANSIGAGGLIGWAAVANSFGIGNKTFGSVSGTNAGAVAGINTATISATICDAVTVNGVTKAAASDEGAWLCPSNTGTITPTYVAHSSSE